MAYFMKSRLYEIHSQKADPEPLETADLIPEFTAWVENSFLLNSRLLILNKTIAF